MRQLFPTLTLMALPLAAAAAEPATNVKGTIDRGLTFLVKDGLAWKDGRRCASCHHAPFTVWALGEAKSRGYAVDEKALADLTAWVVAKEDPAKLFPKQPAPAHTAVNEAPLLLALGLEAGNSKAAQDGLKKLLIGLLREQCDDGSWKLSREARPIGSSPETLTALALLALSAPPAPGLGKEGKAAREKGLAWLRAAHADGEPQAAALRLILWRRLGLPALEWQPLAARLRAAQNADGGWGQTAKAKSDAYATGQALYALAEAGVHSGDEAIRKGQAFLAKTQRQDGAWAMASRAILGNGKPAKNLEPITHAGTAWAVLGLAHSAATPRSNSAAE
jgi:squalene-hopene/tetraprenyl-beta-curcumene cyclase